MECALAAQQQAFGAPCNRAKAASSAQEGGQASGHGGSVCRVRLEEGQGGIGRSRPVSEQGVRLRRRWCTWWHTR